jgi:predicted murein hydrolase (TIGR00659 family)
MPNFILGVVCLFVTLFLYFANKYLYRRFHYLMLMPLILTPALLVALLALTHVSYQHYMVDSQWLLWLLGPATIAFAVPVYENLTVIRRHWLSLSTGVIAATLMAVLSSVWLARLLALPEVIQRSLAVRSITTPFALAAARQVGGQPDLVALFVVITGVFGMAIGDIVFLRLSIKAKMAKGAGLGAASHGAGTARAYELGRQEGVVSSLVMMLAGVLTVMVAPLIGRVMW